MLDEILYIVESSDMHENTTTSFIMSFINRYNNRLLLFIETVPPYCTWN